MKKQYYSTEPSTVTQPSPGSVQSTRQNQILLVLRVLTSSREKDIILVHTAAVVFITANIITSRRNYTGVLQTLTWIGTASASYLVCFVRRSATFALIVDLASVVGFRTLFGFNAFRILNMAHAVPMACPAASIPSLVAVAAFSPYLKLQHKFTVRNRWLRLR
jgi:hypothetical protein